MLSNRLIELIEEHSEQITRRFLLQVERRPELSNMRRLRESELCDWWTDVLRHLGRALSETRDEHLARRYEELGALRFRESVPLHEVILPIHVMKQEMISYIRSHNFAANTVEIYAQEELEHRIYGFFDWLVYHLVRGYEEALHEAAPAAKSPPLHGRSFLKSLSHWGARSS
jgi:hypothetical protein